MNFVPPGDTLMKALRTAGQLSKNAHISETNAETVISELGRFAAEVLVPLDRVSDAKGIRPAQKLKQQLAA
jgi:hypothetical protein